MPSGALSRERDVREAYAAHAGELYGFAVRSLGDSGLAEEAVQETFLRAWRAGERFDPGIGSLRTWLFAIMRNVSVPFGAPYQSFGIYNTEYRTVMDLSKKLYFFELTTRPNVIWVDLTIFDLKAGAPVFTLDPDDEALSGDVSRKFKRAKARLF